MLLFNKICFRDYLLDKAREKEKKEEESKMNISIKLKAYTNDKSPSFNVILGQYHVPLKDFSAKLEDFFKPYNDNVLLNLKITKKLASKEFFVNPGFINLEFLIYQILEYKTSHYTNSLVININKTKLFDLITFFSKELAISFDETTRLFFSYLETIPGGNKSNKRPVFVKFTQN